MHRPHNGASYWTSRRASPLLSSLLKEIILQMSTSLLGNLKFIGNPIKAWLPSSETTRQVVIFLHGSGDTGDGIAEWVESLVTRQIVENDTAVLFPRYCTFIHKNTYSKKK